MRTTIYSNADFLLVRKPHGVPSTFGKAKSFLDRIKKHISEKTFTWTPLSELVPADVLPLVLSRLSDFQEVQDKDEVVRQQVKIFGQDQEFGLVNRLDNDTAGFLYFAKSKEAYDHFKSLQKSGHVKKYYLAQVKGKPQNKNSQSSIFNIQFPIMHHKSDPEKMIAIQKPKDIRLGRSKEHHTLTQVDILHYDLSADISTLLITITKGIRHQIRVHLAAIGHPIIGDALYGKKGSCLHLRSIGFVLY